MKDRFTYFLYCVFMMASIVLCVVFIGTKIEEFRQAARPPVQSVPDVNQLISELDQATAKLQGLIEVERVRLPAGTACGAPPPAEFGSVEWQTDIRVKIQYLRWQVEFLITLRSLDGGKAPGGHGRPIGDSNQ